MVEISTSEGGDGNKNGKSTDPMDIVKDAISFN